MLEELSVAETVGFDQVNQPLTLLSNRTGEYCGRFDPVSSHHILNNLATSRH
jgi:hypothetical protein